MQLLVCTPMPCRTESFWGYLLRLAEANGYDSARELLRYTDQKKHITSKFEVNHIASIVGLPSNELDHISNFSLTNDAETQTSILGHPLALIPPGRSLRLQRPAFCPLCVNEKGYIDAFFDLKHAVGCPIHHTRLLSECHVCGKVLTYFRLGLLTCDCGANLAEAPPSTIDLKTSALLMLIEKKLHREPIWNMPNPFRFPIAEFHCMPLNHLITIIDRIAILDVDLSAVKVSTVDIVDHAVDIFSDWPSGFYSFLKRQNGVFESWCKATPPFRDTFRQLYSSVLDQKAMADSVAFLKRETVRYGISYCSTLVIPEKRCSKAEERRRKRCVIKVASSQRNHSGRSIQDSAANPSPECISVSRKSKGSTTVEQKSNFLTAKLASCMLGLPIPIINELKKSGAFYSEEEISGKKKGLHKTEVSEFLERMLAKSPVKEIEPDTERLVNMHDIVQFFKFRSAPNGVKFLNEYLLGNIKARGRTGKDAKSIYFDKAVALKIARQLRLENDNGAISIYAAAHVAQCDANAIKGLIKSGHLEFLSDSKNGRFPYVSNSSLRDFTAKFIHASSLSRAIKLKERALINLAVENGLKILFVQHDNQGEAVFILRADIPLLKNISNLAIPELSAKERRLVRKNAPEPGTRFPDV
jgi:hypothetical protein